MEVIYEIPKLPIRQYGSSIMYENIFNSCIHDFSSKPCRKITCRVLIFFVQSAADLHDGPCMPMHTLKNANRRTMATRLQIPTTWIQVDKGSNGCATKLVSHVCHELNYCTTDCEKFMATRRSLPTGRFGKILIVLFIHDRKERFYAIGNKRGLVRSISHGSSAGKSTWAVGELELCSAMIAASRGLITKETEREFAKSPAQNLIVNYITFLP